MYIKISLIVVFIISISINLKAQQDYFGQTPPEDSAVIFAPEIISLADRYENGVSFSPDGNIMCFTVVEKNWTDLNIFYSVKENGTWQEAKIADFANIDQNSDVNFTPNNELYFASNRNNSSFWDFDIYKTKFESGAWQNPEKLPSPINSNSGDWYPVLSVNENLYFSSTRNEGEGKEDIWLGINGESGYEIINLGVPVNSSVNEFCPYISKNDSILIFQSERSGGYGTMDLYVSFKSDEGWTNPKNLGSKVNTAAKETAATLTHDEKYLFFARNDNWVTFDNYWIRIDKIIDSLKNSNFVPYVKHIILDQEDTVGNLFSYTIPDSIFFDDDENETLTLSAQLSNGEDLPNYLNFDSNTNTLSGTLAESGTMNIRITATDSDAESVSDVFVLKVSEAAVGINKEANIANISVFPNPAKDYLNIKNASNANLVFQLVSINGKVVKNGMIDKTKLSIKISDVNPGYYILKLQYNNALLKTYKIAVL